MEDQIFSHLREVKRLKWLGHATNTNYQFIKRLLVAEIKGKRPLGRMEGHCHEEYKNVTRSSDRHGI